MKTLKVVVLSRKILFLAIFLILSIQVGLTLVVLRHTYTPTVEFQDPQNGIIIIDPGHGGIDGGTNRDGLLEKDINLLVALKLKDILELKDYSVLMTRDDDISLEGLDHSGSGRHKRDLNTRVSLINASNAQLFVSIHVNSSKSPKADGSIVFYSKRLEQNETLAYSIQRALNSLIVDGIKRTTHNPQKGDYYLLNHTDIPGVIIETAFISNAKEKKLLGGDTFCTQIASAISEGIEQYLNERTSIFKPST